MSRPVAGPATLVLQSTPLADAEVINIGSTPYLTVCSDYLYKVPEEEMAELEQKLLDKNLINVGHPVKNLERVVEKLGPEYEIIKENGITRLMYKGKQIGALTTSDTFREDWDEYYEPVISIDLRNGAKTKHRKPFHSKKNFKAIVEAQRAGYSSPAKMRAHQEFLQKEKEAEKAYS